MNIEGKKSKLSCLATEDNHRLLVQSGNPSQKGGLSRSAERLQEKARSEKSRIPYIVSTSPENEKEGSPCRRRK